MLDSGLAMREGLLEKARELPIEERKQLLYAIWATIEADAPAQTLTPRERAVLEARLEAHHNAPDDIEPWETVRKRLMSVE